MSGKTHSNSTCGLWVLAGLLIFIIVEKICSFDKDLDEDVGTDIVLITGETAPDTSKVDKKTESSTATTNRSTSIITALPMRRRKSSSFHPKDLAVNYDAKILRKLSTTIMNNNNVDDVETESPLTKKSSNIHVSVHRIYFIISL